MFLLQRMALCSRYHNFQCPQCRDQQTFQPEMLTVGIRISNRLVSFSQLLRCEGPRAVPAQGLPRQAWPLAALNMGLSAIGKLEPGIRWMGMDFMG